MTTVTSPLSQQEAQAYILSTSYQHNSIAAGFRIDDLCAQCHGNSNAAGWWNAPRNFGEMIALMHSELSEALEGDRKNLASDHLPGFSMVEEEFADVLIRLFDCAGGMGLRLGQAFEAKIQFNQEREDHKLENRAKPDGKKY